MWFAGMTVFKAVYVFDYENPISLPAHEFIDELLPFATEVGDGNVRSSKFPRFFGKSVEVAAPEGIDPLTTKKSRTFFGFDGDTMEDALHKLHDSLQDISADA